MNETIENMLNPAVPKYSLIHKTREFEALISFTNFPDMADYLKHREDYKRSDIRILRL